MSKTSDIVCLSTEIPDDVFTATLSLVLAHETVTACREGLKGYLAPLREHAKKAMELGYARSAVSLGMETARAAVLIKLEMVEKGLDGAVQYNPRMVALLRDELRNVKNELELVLFTAELEILEEPVLERQLLFKNGGKSNA